MGRPVRSVNRERPFRDMLSGGGRRLRVITEKLIEKAEQGDLQAIREVADRMDRKPAQPIEWSDHRVEMRSDAQLMRIAAGAMPEPNDDPPWPSRPATHFNTGDLIWRRGRDSNPR